MKQLEIGKTFPDRTMTTLSLGLLLSLVTRALAVPTYGAQIPLALPVDHLNALARQAHQEIGMDKRRLEKVLSDIEYM